MGWVGAALLSLAMAFPAPAQRNPAVESLLAIRNADGKSFLSPSDAEVIVGSGQGPSYVHALKDQRNAIGQEFDSYMIAKMAQLGISVEDALALHDTPRPNAIITYPRYAATDFIDPSGNRKGLIDRLKEEYDVWAVIAKSEQDIYSSVLYVPDAKTVVISGHGSPGVVEIGAPFPYEDTRSCVPEDVEHQYLDASDMPELAHHLSALPADAVIYLRACATAEGARPHLASMVREAAGGRDFIAASESFVDCNEHLLSVYPLRMKVTSHCDTEGVHIPSRLSALEDVVGKAYPAGNVPEIDYTFRE